MSDILQTRVEDLIQDLSRPTPTRECDAALVARRLRAKGIRGTSSSTTCPVTNYIRQALDHPDSAVSTGTTSTRVRFDGHYALVSLPRSITRFIHDFDRGRYPSLQDRTVAP